MKKTKTTSRDYSRLIISVLIWIFQHLQNIQVQQFIKLSEQNKISSQNLVKSVELEEPITI